MTCLGGENPGFRSLGYVCMAFLKGLNTHLAALGGVLLSLAGLAVTIAPAVLPSLPPTTQRTVGLAVNVLGLSLAYLGRPVTVKSTAPVEPA